ncbi:MAG: tetratricopeptide repeat protein [Candidatus Acidiferrales bacterium]
MNIRNLFLYAMIGLTGAGATGGSVRAQDRTIAFSTTSAEAGHWYELAMKEREDLLFVDKGIDSMREAVKADPHFALAHAALAYFTNDPMEEKRERALAQKNIENASPDERLMISWLNGTKDGNLVPAIAAMNDLLAKYPHDERLANMDGEWLCSNQGAFEHGEAVLQHVLKNDPKYFPALNNLAYCYALSGQPKLAPALMEQYVALLPNQPNPQDSYGEVMRMLGDYPAALEHYNKALQIDPDFNTSKVGIASTYALMGDQEKARAQYLVAIAGTNERATKFDYRILWAMTYYRENQPEQARQELMKISTEAERGGLAIEHAEAHRDMALFNPEPQGALKDIDHARAALLAHDFAWGDRDNELATILFTRAFIAARAGLQNEAQKSVQPLSVIARTSRSDVVQRAYHSANGALLSLQGKYDAAIKELEDDAQNPLALQLLADAQEKAGQAAEAQKTLVTLAAINDERVETAVAVPPARAALKANPPTTAEATPFHVHP